MSVLTNLTKLGLTLPQPTSPGGAYSSVNVVRDMAYVAIQFPIWNGEYRYLGRLGRELTTPEGYQAAQLCALNVLSQIQKHVGFEHVISLNHFDAYYQSVAPWDDAPQAINGASDLFLTVLEGAGRHARAILGVECLPRNFSVGITATFTITS